MTTTTTATSLKTEVDTERLQSATKLIGSIDQGTSSSRFIVFSNDGRPVASAQVTLRHRYIHVIKS